MKNHICIKDALRMAEVTGQQITITLRGGTEFHGCIVEELWPSTCRLWLNPCRQPYLGGPVGATEVNELEIMSSQCPPRDCIEKAIVAIQAIESIAFDHEIIADCGPFPGCNKDTQGIQDALTIALITRQIVKVGVIDKGHTDKLRGQIVSVDNEKFCIRLVENDRTKLLPIDKVEFVKFS